MHPLNFYLSNGAVDITATIAFVLGFVQVTKGIFNPLNTDTQLHDTMVNVYTLVLTLGAVLFLTWAGPGFHNRTDVASALIEVVIAWMTSQGVYVKIRGPVPQTPTAVYKQEAAHRLGFMQPVDMGTVGYGTYPVKESPQPMSEKHVVKGSITPRPTLGKTKPARDPATGTPADDNPEVE